jgi:hypothetical protein
MTVKGGDIRQFTLEGRNYDVKSESEVEINLGGFENEAITSGNGNVGATQKRVPASMTGLAIIADDENGDFQALKDLSDSGKTVPMSLTQANGIVYSGSVFITGPVVKKTSDGSIDLSVSGSKIEKI